MTVRWIRLLFVALSLALIVAACGEDEDASTATVETGTGSESLATELPVEPTVPADDATSDEDSGTAGGTLQWDAAPDMRLEAGTDYRAVLRTSKGDITIDILETVAPIAANNFVFLAQEGYYTDVPFHRIIQDFMIQGGDPTGTGTGGPGYTIQDEPVVGEYTRGTVAMARTSAPNSAGSQFFIMHQDYPQLPKDYVIFGTVTEGFEVVDAIATSPVVDSGTGEISSPEEPIMLESVEIVTE